MVAILPTISIQIERWKFNERMKIYISTMGRIKDTSGNIQHVAAKNNYLVFRGNYVHRLVAETWLGMRIGDNLTVDHKNHNTRDNSIYNLEVVTETENLRREAEDSKTNLEQFDNMSNKFNVLLNGAKIQSDCALTIIKNTPGVNKESNKRINRIFNNLYLSKPGTSTKFANYTIVRC